MHKMMRYIFVLLLLLGHVISQDEEICSNLLNDDNNIILDVSILNEIELGTYTYEDIFNCLENESILQVNTDNSIQPNSTIIINNNIQIQSIIDNDEKAIFKCPTDNTPLFIINSTEEVIISGITIESCDINGSNGIIHLEADSVATVKDSAFKNNNNNNGDGSVLFSTSENAKLTLINNVIESHETNSSLITIEEGSVLTIESSRFENNTINSAGGIIKVEVQGNEYETLIEIINNYFINNKVEENQGCIIWGKGLNVTLNIEESYFLRNSATYQGGSIYIEEGPRLNIINSVFIDNESLEGGGGGAILAAGENEKTEVIVSSSVFSLNKAEELLGTGGAIRIDGNYLNCTIHEDTIFIYNRASMDGGAIYVAKTALATIKNSIFSKNFAVRAGGGVSITADKTAGYSSNVVSFDNCTFTENTATSFVGGGAIYGGGSDAKIHVNGGYYANNTCVTGSGGVFRMFNGPFLRLRENAQFISNFGYWGGLLFAENDVTVDIADIKVEDNVALYLGGAIYGSGDVDLTIDNCEFIHNKAIDGGAIKIKNYFDSDDQESRIQIRNTKFENNIVCDEDEDGTFESNGCFGGGITFEGMGIHTNIDTCSFHNNRAPKGGAIYLYCPKKFETFRSNYTGNVAIEGGAISFRMYNPTYWDFAVNIAYDVNFFDNVAEEGGALFCSSIADTLDDDKTPQLYIAQFENNTATVDGGAIFAEKVYIAIADTHFINNKQEKMPSLNLFEKGEEIIEDDDDNGDDDEEEESKGGGAITLQKRAIAEITYLSTFVNNTSNGTGGAINAMNSYLIINDVDFNNNSARLNGGAISYCLLETIGYVTDKYTHYLTTDNNVNFVNNSAGGDGGGIFIKKNRKMKDNNIVNFKDTSFINNTAHNGGAIYTTNSTSVFICCNCSAEESIGPLPLNEVFYDNGKLLDSSLCENYFENNECCTEREENTGACYGMDVASCASNVTMNPDYIKNPLSEFRSDDYLQMMNFTFKDQFGQNVNNSELTITLSSNDTFALSGQLEAELDIYGVASFTATRLTGKSRIEPYIIDITFLSEDDEELIQQLSFNITIRNCTIGEKLVDESITKCEICEVGQYNFEPMSKECQTNCPKDADCLIDGCTITPHPGYWHSTSFSTQIRKCIYEKACNQVQRTELLSWNAYSKVQEGTDVQYYFYDDANYNQCSEGYKGRLCGKCDENYAKAGDECEKCLGKAGTIFFIVLQYILTIGIIVYLIVSVVNLLKRLEFNRTYQKSRKMKEVVLEKIEEDKELSHQNKKSEIQEVRQSVESVETPSPTSSRAMLSNKDNSPFDMSNGLDSPHPTTSSQDLNEVKIGTINTNVRPFSLSNPVAEVLKILINYLQVTSIAILINVNWTTTMKKMFVTQEIASSFTASTGSAYFSFECVMSSDIEKKALTTILLNIFMPIAYFIIILTGWLVVFIVKRRSYCLLKNRVILTILSILYVSYIGVTKNILKFFQCLKIDSNDVEVYSQWPDHYPNTGRYWREDTEIVCYTDSHLVVLIVVAIPLIIAYTIGYPLFVILKLKNNRDKWEDDEFVSKYGFLYKAYNKEMIYWEALIMGRKAAVAAIVVFSYDLGGNLQGLLVCIILFISFSLQLTFMPFSEEYPKLNYLEVYSLSSTMLIFMSGLLLNDEQTSETVRMFITVVAFLIFIATIFKMIFDMMLYSEDYMNMKLIELNIVDYKDLSDLNLQNKAYKIASHYGSMGRDSTFYCVGQFKKSGRDIRHRNR